MKTKKSFLFAWILALTTCIAFFLPMARITPTNPLDLAGRMAQDASPLEIWLTMRSDEWEAIWHNPGEGLSAYQLVLLQDENSLSSKVAKACLTMFWGSENATGKIRFLALAPILALLGAIAMSMRNAPIGFMAATAAGQLIFYIFTRWKLDMSFATRLMMQIEFNLGLWLMLYSLLLLSLLLLAKCAFPRSKW